MTKNALMLSVALCLSTAPAFASDWGYDSPKQETVEPMKATTLPLGGKGNIGSSKAAGASSTRVNGGAGRGVPAKTATQSPNTVPHKTATAATKVAPKADAQSLTEECWQQIYEIAAGTKLSAEQKHDVAELVKTQLSAGGTTAAQAKSVLAFWPRVMTYLASHPEQKENYSGFMRSLLRFRARSAASCNNAAEGSKEQDESADKPPDQSSAVTSKAPIAAATDKSGAMMPKLAPVPDALAQREINLVANILGPVRFAVPGDPPFTEEAINAYSDMACFIYEQRNPGKTVDALDNRAVFAHVVAQKFREAPRRKDKEGMAAFDLTWSRFKIAWTEAPEASKSRMVELLNKSGAGSAASVVNDPVMQSVLQNWPSFRPQS